MRNVIVCTVRIPYPWDCAECPLRDKCFKAHPDGSLPTTEEIKKWLEELEV